MSPISIPGKVKLLKDFSWANIWNPSVISTELWLDAADASTITESGGAVSQWNDKSGNGRDATASSTAQPTYSSTAFNGKPGLSFNGTSNVLSCDSLATIASGDDIPWSAIWVTNVATRGVAQCMFSFSDTFTTFTGHLVDISGSEFIETVRRSPSDGSAQRLTAATAASNANQIMALNFTGTFCTLYLNGSTDAAGLLNSGSLTMNRFSIGAARRAGTTNLFAECITSEIIVFSGTLSTDTRQKLEGYLGHKWGLTANLPNDHPYKFVGPMP